MNMIFLKGYQWPFDARKVADGSSMIDLLVYREIFVKEDACGWITGIIAAEKKWISRDFLRVPHVS